MPERGRLREARRRATEIIIEEAAVTLALEHGHERVTIDAICQASGISRSTFFNYYSSRESALFGRGAAPPAHEEAFAIMDAHAPDLLRGIFALGAASVGQPTPSADVAAARERLFETQPTARRYILDVISDVQTMVIDQVSAYLAAHPELCALAPERHADEAMLAVGSLSTVGMLTSPHWFASARDLTQLESGFFMGVDDLRRVLHPRGGAGQA